MGECYRLVFVVETNRQPARFTRVYVPGMCWLAFFVASRFLRDMFHLRQGLHL